MSDDENFLSRWSRRKRDVAKSEAPPPPDAAPKPPAAEAQASPESKEPEFDLSQLPSLDSITASTDISAFMQAGVPSALRHAALRRAWVADPAIRNFISPAEYAWDFTDPDAMPGFGALDPGVDVKKLVADVFRDATEPPAEKTAAAETPVPAATEESAAPKAREPEPGSQEPEMVQRDSDFASQQEGERGSEPTRFARKHGGATPQ